MTTGSGGKSVYLVLEVKCDETLSRLLASPGQLDLRQIIASEKLQVVRLETRPEADNSAISGASPSKSLGELEKEYIVQVLASNGGNRSLAAKVLNINRRTLQRKIAQF